MNSVLSACPRSFLVLMALGTQALASPSLVGYTVIGGGGVDDVANGSKSTYIATDAGDEIKVAHSYLSSFSSFDKVTLLACGKQCGPLQAPLIVLIKGKVHEGKLLVAGTVRGYGHPLSDAEGFTVVAQTEVSKVVRDAYGSRVIKMVDGKAIKVSMLLLDPLYGTDAIILGRTYEIVDKQTGKTKTFTIFKLLLDGSDLYDVAP